MKRLLVLLLLLPGLANAASIDSLTFTHDGKDINGNDQEPSSFMLYVGLTPRGACVVDCYPTKVPLPDPTLRTIEGQIFPLTGVVDGDIVVAAVTAWDDEGNESEYSDEKGFRVNVIATDTTPPTKPNLVSITYNAESLAVTVTCPDGYVCTVELVEAQQ